MFEMSACKGVMQHFSDGVQKCVGPTLAFKKKSNMNIETGHVGPICAGDINLGSIQTSRLQALVL